MRIAALAAAERATRLAPQLAEAWFNRAIALESVYLPEAAQSAWVDFLRLDSASEWAAEARDRRRALADAGTQDSWPARREALSRAVARRDHQQVLEIVRRSPAAVRHHVWETILPSWARAALDGHDRLSRESLREALAISEALARRMRADLLVSSIAEIANARGPNRLRTLAAAHDLAAAGRQLYEETRVSDARRPFQRALHMLGRTGSVLALDIRFRLAQLTLNRGESDVARRELLDVLAHATRRQFDDFAARVHWSLGSLAMNRSRLDESLSHYRQALALFEDLQDPDGIATSHALVADNLLAQGEHGELWRHQLQALALLDRIYDRRRRHNVLFVAGYAADREEWPEAALHFHDAILRNARSWGLPAAMVTGHVHRARTLTRLGDSSHAREDLQTARRLTAQLDDRRFAERYEAEILLVQGELEEDASPERAIAAYTTALELWARHGSVYRLTQLHHARARSLIKIGQTHEAELELARAIDALETQRSELRDQERRISHFDRLWDVFAETIRFQAVVRGQFDRAFEAAERSRARVLHETIGRYTPQELAGPREVARRLRPGQAIISYVVLPERLLTWVVTASDVGVIDRRVTAAALGRLVRRYLATLEEPDGRQDESAASELYDVVLREARYTARTARTLIVVPDGPLNLVPFAALVDRDTGRYLVEDAAVSVAPSATLYARTNDRAASQTVGPPRSAFVIGDPRIDPAEFPGLSSLPSARTEAKDVAGLYPGATLVVGGAATKRAFLERFGEHDVVHVAAHAVTNEDFPTRSRLALAPNSGEAGGLDAAEIARACVTRTKLIVLAACRTARGTTRRGEGVLSLARPFLAAGVATVVATLWDVDDAASRELMAVFHQRVSHGDEPIVALRRAQLAMLTHRDTRRRRPPAWAGYVVIGG
jgi:CHAT domain-containing protein